MIAEGLTRASTGLHLAVGRISRGLAVLLAAIPPILYFVMARTIVETELNVEARFVAHEIGQVAARNPSHWTFEVARLETIIDRVDDREEPEARLVRDAEGGLVIQIGAMPPWPTTTNTVPLIAGGQEVGTVSMVYSLVEQMQITALVTVLSTLLAALSYFMFRQVPERMLEQALRQVTHLATHDVLTGQPNRTLFMDRLNLAMAAIRRDENSAVALLCLDLDRFKEVNDTLGHGVGDELLRQVTARLRAELRDTDTLARLGGDEFAIILQRMNHPHSAETLTQRLIRVVEAPFDLGAHQVIVGVSIGIAIARGRSHGDPADLLRDADTALYAAKREGRGTFRFFAEEMNAALRERRALEADLRQAMRRSEFELHYQPQVNLSDGRLIGVEALLRWHHPTRGFVMPDSFIPLAEEIGMLPELGAWVLREACTNATRWEGVRIAVNVSAHQIHAGGFETLVARALSETGLAPERLEIEITEGVLLTQTESTIATLEQIRALGVSIAMDDFGTGYSSLGYLQRFHFDKLKIDRSFIQQLEGNAESAAIVEAVLGITRALGVKANAEGVETEAQARILASRGCNEAQGWLFGRPVPAEAIAEMLARGQPLTAAVV